MSDLLERLNGIRSTYDSLSGDTSDIVREAVEEIERLTVENVKLNRHLDGLENKILSSPIITADEQDVVLLLRATCDEAQGVARRFFKRGGPFNCIDRRHFINSYHWLVSVDDQAVGE